MISSRIKEGHHWLHGPGVTLSTGHQRKCSIHWYVFLPFEVTGLDFEHRSHSRIPGHSLGTPMHSTSTSDQQHWYLKFVINPLLPTLRSVAEPPRRFLSHAPLSSGGQHGYVRLVFNSLLRSPRFIAVLTTQLLTFKPDHLTPGRYALETVGKWPSRFMMFSRPSFTFLCAGVKSAPAFSTESPCLLQ